MRIEPVRRRRVVRPSLTPLIDVVFLLLVFFVIGGRLQDESRIRIAGAAPTVEQTVGTASPTPVPRVLLALESRAVWRFAGDDAAPDAVLDRIAAARAQHPALEVVLAPGPGLTAQGLVEAIDRLQALGIARIAYLAE